MSLFSFFSDEAPPLVDKSLHYVLEMVSTGRDMFAAATAYVLDNEILDVDLGALDEEINQRDQMLRRAVLEHLTIDPGSELIFSLKLISIVHEAERIGDLAKSLAKTGALARKPRMGRHAEPLREQRDSIMNMFVEVHRGFLESDVSVTRETLRQHEAIKDQTKVYMQRLAEDDAITPNEAVVYALTARQLSRVSSHLSNIASAVASPFDQIRRTPV